MLVWQWLGLAVAAAAVCMVVRVQQPQMASVCASAAGLMLVAVALESVGNLKELFGRLTALAGLQEGYLQPLFKAMGISYAAELAAQVCTDLGEGGLAVKVGLMGRLCVFALTAPLMMSILEMILELVP